VILGLKRSSGSEIISQLYKEASNDLIIIITSHRPSKELIPNAIGSINFDHSTMNVTAVLTAALMSACVVSARLMGHDWSHNSSHLWNTNVVNDRREVARRVQFVPFDLLQTLTGHTDVVRSVAFNNNGTRIVWGPGDHSRLDNTIKVWDVQNGRAAQTLSGHTDVVRSVAYNNDGTRIVSGSDDNTIKLWDAQNGGAALQTFSALRRVWSVGFNNDGTRIVSGGFVYIKIWDAQNGGAALQTLKGHYSIVRSVAYNNDGTRIVSGSRDNTIKIWDAQNGGAALQTLSGHTDDVYSVGFNNDGTRIVSGSLDYTIKIWDAQWGGAALQTLSGHTAYVWSVSFNNDGTRIVSGSNDNTIKIWGEMARTLVPTSAPVTPPMVAPVSPPTPRPSSLPSVPLLKPAVPIAASQTLSTSNIVIIVCVGTTFLVICFYFGRRCIKPSVVKTPKDEGDCFADNPGTDTRAVPESALHTQKT